MDTVSGDGYWGEDGQEPISKEDITKRFEQLMEEGYAVQDGWDASEAVESAWNAVPQHVSEFYHEDEAGMRDAILDYVGSMSQIASAMKATLLEIANKSDEFFCTDETYDGDERGGFVSVEHIIVDGTHQGAVVEVETEDMGSFDVSLNTQTAVLSADNKRFHPDSPTFMSTTYAHADAVQKAFADEWWAHEEAAREIESDMAHLERIEDE